VSEGTIRAAGGVLWRNAADANGPAAIEVAVIHRQRYDDWTLPKGKLAAGEREVDGAIREVLEETGYHVRLGRSLGETRYLKGGSGVARQKVVRWWAMEAASGGFGPTREVDELRWLTLGDAHDALTRDLDRDVLDRFVRGSAAGRMVLLVRNGSAVSRSGWDGDDGLRPLDACGWAQADELVRLLAHFDPNDIRSANVIRCQQTVLPLASALGVPVTEEPLLSVDGFSADEAGAATLVRSAGDVHGCVVLSGQGDVIAGLVGRLSEEDDVDLAEPPVARKASVWALELQGDRLVSAEYFPPPDAPECSGQGLS
jgi:8-oxo-dGTP diphosphatase